MYYNINLNQYDNLRRIYEDMSHMHIVHGVVKCLTLAIIDPLLSTAL